MLTSFSLIFNIVKNLSKEEIFNKIYPFYSFFILFISEFMCLKLKIFENYSIIILLINGLYFGFQTSKVILCTMSDVINFPLNKFSLIKFFSNLIKILLKFIKIFLLLKILLEKNWISLLWKHFSFHMCFNCFTFKFNFCWGYYNDYQFCFSCL